MRLVIGMGGGCLESTRMVFSSDRQLMRRASQAKYRQKIKKVRKWITALYLIKEEMEKQDFRF